MVGSREQADFVCTGLARSRPRAAYLVAWWLKVLGVNADFRIVMGRASR